ncbi:hypothetical protein BH24ACT19_BH24ACT19_13340 [soil metagenome]|jgi:hypothetical protein
MTEERQSFWHRIFFGTGTGTERERKVREYIIHRIGEGAHLRDVLGEEYVRRNASPAEAEQILDNPALVEAAYEQMRNDFTSGDLDPKRSPGSAR